MSVWNYIGEFFLFRWISGKLRKSTILHNTHTEVSGSSIDRGSEYVNDNHDEGIAPEDAVTDVSDNLLDDFDNSEGLENLDYLDIFMRNNNGNNHSCLHYGDYGGDYHSSGRHRFQNDCNSGSSPQSYNDFLDEQDDYDIIDDDF